MVDKYEPIVATTQERGDSETRSQPSKTHAGPSPFGLPKLIVEFWWKELLAILICAFDLVALAVTVHSQEGKTIHYWPLSLSINTVVAIFTIIFKAALLFVLAEGIGQLKWLHYRKPRALDHVEAFDNAIRGPYSALNLVWATRARNFAAAAGAALVLITLIAEPFSQQLVFYYGCETVAVGAPANLPRSNGYGEHGIHMAYGRETAPPNVRRSLTMGVVGAEYVAVQPSCSTGNCTWEPFHTIGFCSQCTDISDRITLYHDPNYTTPDGVPGDAYSYIVELEQGLDADYNVPNLTSFKDPKATIAGGVKMLQIVPTAKGTTVFAGFIKGNPDMNGVVLPHPICGANDQSWPCNGTGAATCTLQSCVRTYKATQTNGVLQEELIAKHVPAHGDYQPAILSKKCLKDYDVTAPELLNNSTDLDWIDVQPDSGKDFWIDLTDHEKNPTVNESISVTAGGKNHSVPSTCVYMMRGQTETSLLYYAKNALVGDVTTNVNSGIVPQLAMADNGSAIADAVFQGGNVSFASVSRTWENISEALTVYTRQNGRDGMNKASKGVARKYDTCVGVQWRWITYPAGVLVLLFCFALYIIARSTWLRSRGDTVPEWKSSSLPSLLAGLDEGLKARLHTSRDVDDMQRVAAGVRVRLVETDRGVRLVESR